MPNNTLAARHPREAVRKPVADTRRSKASYSDFCTYGLSTGTTLLSSSSPRHFSRLTVSPSSVDSITTNVAVLSGSSMLLSIQVPLLAKYFVRS